MREGLHLGCVRVSWAPVSYLEMLLDWHGGYAELHVGKLRVQWRRRGWP
jgi:hypothetical protein